MVHGDRIIIYPKPFSFHLGETIGFRDQEGFRAVTPNDGEPNGREHGRCNEMENQLEKKILKWQLYSCRSRGLSPKPGTLNPKPSTLDRKP